MPVGPQHPHVEQHTENKVRKLPVSTSLADLLEAAAIEAGIDTVWIYSGGQYAVGTSDRRVGTTRHDLGAAADVHLIVASQKLNFDTEPGRSQFARFLEACAAYGAEGIGAAPDYMGPMSAHVGYGARAVWGKDGKFANAPDWVKTAVARGWARRNRLEGSTDDSASPEELEILLTGLPQTAGD